MKKIYHLLFCSCSIFGFSQNGAPANPYYNGFDWTLRGMNLKNALSTKITDTHTNKISYADVWQVSKITDLVDPTNPLNSNVYLIYGWENGTDADNNNDLVRDKDLICSGPVNCSTRWNREHVYAKDLGTPNLVDQGSGASSDAGEDAHHIRPADVEWNSDRGNEKFIDASGNSRSIVNNVSWYPGDEWKGDVARMMMYMYLRYPTQCKPINVGFGNSLSIDTDMIDLFLKWNKEDPVSQLEDNRNIYHGNASNTYAQGNRNPFIDNPYLATLIWGGTPAQNRWTFLNNEEFYLQDKITISPNPSNGIFKIHLDETLEAINLEIYSTLGQKVLEKNSITTQEIEINDLSQGVYLAKFSKDNQVVVKKIVIN